MILGIRKVSSIAVLAEQIFMYQNRNHGYSHAVLAMAVALHSFQSVLCLWSTGRTVTCSGVNLYGQSASSQPPYAS